MKISIPEPCNEDWQKMLPNEKGRFCLNCQKSVIDFTNKSNREIINYLLTNTNVCGRLHPSKLNTNLKPEENKNISKWHTYFLSVIAFLGIELANNQNAKAQNTTIKGKVVDKDKTPVPGATVILDYDKKIGTVSDVDGLFSFEIPQKDSLNKILVMGAGFKDTSFVVKNVPKDWVVELEEDYSEIIIPTSSFIGGGVVVEVRIAEPPTFWERFKSLFRRKH